MDAGSFAGLKALYSDARKRAGVAAGIGAYLYTVARPGRAADRPRRPAGPVDPPRARQVRPARDLPGHRAMAQTGLRGAHEHARGQARPRRDPRPRRTRNRHGPGRSRRGKPASQRHPRGARRRGATSTGGQTATVWSAWTSAASDPPPREHATRAAGSPPKRRRPATRPTSSPSSRTPPCPPTGPGEQLEDTQIEQVTAAVEVLAQAGYRAESLAEHIADYRRRHGEDWRQRLWRRALRLASLRYRHPDAYGLSPCETDPDRLAQHARPPAGTAARHEPPEPSPSRH